MEGWNGIFPGIFQLWEDPSRLKRDRWGVHPRLKGASLNIPHCGQALAPPLRSASSGLSPCPGPRLRSLSCSFTTTTKESHSRPFSLLPSEPCDRPWESPHTCPRPT